MKLTRSIKFVIKYRIYNSIDPFNVCVYMRNERLVRYPDKKLNLAVVNVVVF